jgi:hypothetical protein
MSESKAIRQTAPTALNLIEVLGDSVPPKLAEAIKLQFQAEEEANGKLGLEFLQGFYSGLHFAHDWVTKAFGARDDAAGLIAVLAIEVARKYIERLEEGLPNKN